VHMLTDAAFNALLKTLEEPPPHVVFILATTESHKLPATIASRCQRFDFRRIPLAAAVRRLETICEAEGITCEPTALELLARSATGSLRDSTNLLDQLATTYGNTLTVEHVRVGLGLIGDERAGRLARLALAGDLAGGLTLIASVRDDGLDLRQFQRELIDELRDLLMIKSGLEPSEGATQERLQDLRGAVTTMSTAQIVTALRSFGEADLKADPNSTLPLDIALAECALGIGQASNQSTAPEPQAARTEVPAPAAVRRVAPEPAPTPARAEPAPAPVSVRREPPAPVTPARPEPAMPEPGSDADERGVRPDPVAPAASNETAARARPASSGPVAADLGSARQQMRHIYEKARTTGFQVGALLNSGCDIIEADESSIVFGFKFPVHAEKAADKRNLETLTTIVSEVMGRTVSVRCVLDITVEPWNLRQSNSPLVRAAQEMGARVLQSEPEEST
jgi:DNA polymerase III subunit gamma/tau